MKTISTSAIVALMTATIGLGALAPTLAQETAPATQSQPADTNPAEHGFRHGGGMRQGSMGGGMGGGMGGFLNIERGAEAIEIAIVRLTHAIDLTDEQSVLLEDLKSDALAAAAAFETATDGLRPTPPAEGETAERPDMSERFGNRIAIQSAQLAALEAVQPAFAAFFDSLTDEQLAELMPEHGERAAGMGKHGGGQHGGQHPMGPGNR
ncbi:Spy/CpxP family protein refolding chaperone [Devosia sp. XJ19-1]|uniref:Spy/CpxP family protein refolding chaperone n=1 Tax=Devosia ureilytica TaxID=2952754 RepID=A0A9Q4ANH9_9HYPH|nr:Spy/CpxP family protein refolding chaperone [Devosia ureilytica]MCP8883850.1 Spy/CpxP family protein refolding chaperone [Devosia ureilytica]MCP8887458.1 Spy/CpxP family protein refolding chaperone [Devosia ureilytica]